MAAGDFVRLSGPVNSKAAGSTLDIPVHALGHAAGNTVVVGGSHTDAGTLASVSDSKGNTYTEAVLDNANAVRAGMWFSVLDTALVSGDVITVTYGTAQNRGQVHMAGEWEGAGTFASPAVSAAGISAAPSSGTKTPPSAPAVAIGWIVAQGEGADLAVDGSWDLVGFDHTGIAGPTVSNIQAMMERQALSTTDPVAATATLAEALWWAGIAVFTFGGGGQTVAVGTIAETDTLQTVAPVQSVYPVGTLAETDTPVAIDVGPEGPPALTTNEIGIVGHSNSSSFVTNYRTKSTQDLILAISQGSVHIGIWGDPLNESFEQAWSNLEAAEPVGGFKAMWLMLGFGSSHTTAQGQGYADEIYNQITTRFPTVEYIWWSPMNTYFSTNPGDGDAADLVALDPWGTNPQSLTTWKAADDPSRRSWNVTEYALAQGYADDYGPWINLTEALTDPDQAHPSVPDGEDHGGDILLAFFEGIQDVSVTPLAETESLVGITPVKAIIQSVGTITETESLNATASFKTVPIGTIAETNTLIDASPVKPIVASVGVVTETDALIAISVLKPIVESVGALTEIETLIGITSRKAVDIGVLAQTEPLVGIQAVKEIIEAVGVLAGTNTLISVQAVKPIFEVVGILTETDSLVAVEAVKPVVVGITPLAQSDALIALSALKTASISPLVETDSLLTVTAQIGGDQNIAVGSVSELDALVAIQALKPIIQVVGTLGELDIPIAITGRKTVDLGTISEINTLIGIGVLKPIIRAIGGITETDSLVEILAESVVIAALAETNTLVGVSSIQATSVTPLVEIETLVDVGVLTGAIIETILKQRTYRDGNREFSDSGRTYRTATRT